MEYPVHTFSSQTQAMNREGNVKLYTTFETPLLFLKICPLSPSRFCSAALLRRKWKKESRSHSNMTSEYSITRIYLNNSREKHIACITTCTYNKLIYANSFFGQKKIQMLIIWCTYNKRKMLIIREWMGKPRMRNTLAIKTRAIKKIQKRWV